jgi:hypothetical protein
VLKPLAHRLEGTTTLDDYEEKDVAFTEREVCPFLNKVDTAYYDVFGQLELVKDDRLKLEKRHAHIEILQVRLRTRLRSTQSWLKRLESTRSQLVAMERRTPRYLKLMTMMSPV